MKNLTRAVVLVFALNGLSVIYTRATLVTPSVTAFQTKAAAFPIPTCPWNDPNACGIGGTNPHAR